MSDKERPLPQPPGTPFGRKKNFEQPGENAPMMADLMSMAMAEGRLDEFMNKEMPDNEYARSLAMMMMGMTGMMPSESPAADAPPISEKAQAGQPACTDPSPQPPDDVIKAVQTGDVEALKGMLAREHQKRSGGDGTHDTGKTVAQEETAPSGAIDPSEKELLDQLVKIASEGNTTVDWLIMRALKLYIQEYRKTGRL